MYTLHWLCHPLRGILVSHTLSILLTISEASAEYKLLHIDKEN